MGSRARELYSWGARALLLRHTGSLFVVHGPSSPVVCGILVPRPGIKPASPALQDGFLTTRQPGKSLAFPLARNESCCSTPSPAFGFVSVPDYNHSNKCVMVSLCFNLHFPDDIWCRIYFRMLICHLYIFFGEVPVKIFGPFFNQVGFFFSLLSVYFG